MRLAQIEDGIVVNVIEVDPNNIPDWADGWPEAGQAGPGWTYADGVFSPPPGPTPDEVRAALPPITRRQLRLTLRREAGITPAMVEGILAGIEDEGEREDALIEWEAAGTYERLHPTLLAIADGLGLSPEQVDEMWVQAMEA